MFTKFGGKAAHTGQGIPTFGESVTERDSSPDSPTDWLAINVTVHTQRSADNLKLTCSLFLTKLQY